MHLRLLCLLIVWTTTTLAAQELKLVHAIFTHKYDTPPFKLVETAFVEFSKNGTHPYLTGLDDMTNDAKLTMYNLGIYLRQRYDKLLGDMYTSEVTRMRTTESIPSKISGQLVNAALWPPVGIQQWDEHLQWQPIPMELVPVEKDTLLLGTFCPNFLAEMKEVLARQKTRSMILSHRPLFDYIYNNSGLKVDQPFDIAFLYQSFETSASKNITLPSWAEGIFPYGEMYNVSLMEYDFLSETSLQKQLNGGTLLKKIISDSNDYINGNISSDRKIMLYSGDDKIIAGILHDLGLWSPHIPNIAATIIFELYLDSETKTHGLKIIYYTGEDDETISLTLPECTEICSLEDFSRILSDVLPKNEKSLCGWQVVNEHREYVENSSSSNAISFMLVLLLICCYQIIQNTVMQV